MAGDAQRAPGQEQPREGCEERGPGSGAQGAGPAALPSASRAGNSGQLFSGGQGYPNGKDALSLSQDVPSQCGCQWVPVPLLQASRCSHGGGLS